MPLHQDAQLPPITIGGQWRPGGKGPHDDIEVRVAYGIFNTPVLTQMLGGVELSQLRVTKVDYGWLIMLKGVRRGRYLVAFFSAPTMRDVFVLMTTCVDIGYVTWKDDDHPPTG